MKRITRSLKALSQIQHDAAVDAMAEALPTADLDAQVHLVNALAQRRSKTARMSLVRQFARLSEDAQAAVLEQQGELQSSIRAGLKDRRSAHRMSAIQLASATRDVDLLLDVAEACADGDEDVRRAAVDCILSHPIETKSEFESDSPSTRSTVRAAVVAAMRHFEQHQSSALLVRMFEMAIPPRLFGDQLANPECKLIAALRQMLAEAVNPSVRTSLLNWLGEPALTLPASHALRSAARDGWLAQLLDHAHLLGNDRIRRSVADTPHPREMLPTLPQQATMQAPAQRQLASWIATISLSDEDRVTAFAQVARSEDPSARLFALRRLIDDQSRLSAHLKANLIAAFCYDSDVRVARIAVRHLIAANPNNLPQTLLRLISSEHESIRQLAGQRVAPWGFAWFWNGWTHLNHPQRVSAARALLKIDPKFHRHLGDRLLSRKPDDRLKALTMVGELNQGVFYENALIAFARGTRTREAASAVRALTTVQSELVGHVIEASLAHGDSRVRANAVEALGRRRAGRVVHQLETMAERETNRPRANAIAELFKLDRPVAYDALSAMLDDQHTNHRISGLWLAGAMSIIGTAPRIAAMATDDTDEAVRQRAHGTFERLVSAMTVESEPNPAAEQTLPRKAAV